MTGVAAFVGALQLAVEITVSVPAYTLAPRLTMRTATGRISRAFLRGLAEYAMVIRGISTLVVSIFTAVA